MDIGSMRPHQKLAYEFAMRQYQAVDDYIKEDLLEACVWAKEQLTNLEGAGWILELLPERGQIVCCFSKPSWAGDHSGPMMETGAQAVVMAVCTYRAGC